MSSFFHSLRFTSHTEHLLAATIIHEVSLFGQASWMHTRLFTGLGQGREAAPSINRAPWSAWAAPSLQLIGRRAYAGEGGWGGGGKCG